MLSALTAPDKWFFGQMFTASYSLQVRDKQFEWNEYHLCEKQGTSILLAFLMQRHFFHSSSSPTYELSQPLQVPLISLPCFWKIFLLARVHEKLHPILTKLWLKSYLTYGDRNPAQLLQYAQIILSSLQSRSDHHQLNPSGFLQPAPTASLPIFVGLKRPKWRTELIPDTSLAVLRSI